MGDACPSDTHDGDPDNDTTSPNSPPDENRIVRHIMVIGFHHKHGYQVDYCYPPLTPDGPVFTTPSNSITLPSCWKTLPLLCLPDGSHNFDSDAIYFTMPDVAIGTNEACDQSISHQEGIKTIFGTACYRQIHVEKLLNRTDDMTRVAVQKSVCVLSTQPLFGLIRSKLEMITHAYFEELDFSKVRILKLTYDNLNSLLARDSVRENAAFLGLSARQLVSYFGNNMLVLYKAMLLEKKILFYKSPVKDLCSTIMSMCSLFNGLIENGGLDHSTCDLQLSPTLLEALKLTPKTPTELGTETTNSREGKVFFSPSKEEVVIIDNSTFDETFNGENSNQSRQAADIVRDLEQGTSQRADVKSNEGEFEKTGEYEVIEGPIELSSGNQQATNEHEGSTLTDETIIDDQYAHKLCQMKPEFCGLPLQIFTRGSFCLPYLSISYLDLLSDKRVRSFVIGATNFLFKQRRDMYDVIVDMEDNSIVISDTNLKRLLNLTIEDLRFMDYINKHVRLEGINRASNVNPNESMMFDPINHDVTKWLGGDEWIRYLFKIYTLYLLKAAKTQTNLESFNGAFVHAWKISTNNYRIWDTTGKSSILNDLQARHPFSSAARGINLSDMKLKLSYAVNSSDKGRIMNQTLNGIGRWSIWNNIASAGNMAASTVSSIATSASAAASSAINPVISSNSAGIRGGGLFDVDKQHPGGDAGGAGEII